MKNQVMKLAFKIVLMVLVLGQFSCVSHRKIEYIQDISKFKDTLDLKYKEAVINPFDELYIRVSSFDDVEYNFFSNQSSEMRMGFSNEFSVSLISYTVDPDGNIYFPLLGSFSVGKLTILEATNKLQIALSEYFNQPTVLMRKINKRFSVLGYVNRPGRYSYTQERINIFEAISMAGDINFHGDHKEIMILRTINDKTVSIPIDLTKDDIIESDYYFLQPDDIIYIKPRLSAQWTITSVPYSLILSTITTFLLILRYVQ